MEAIQFGDFQLLIRQRQLLDRGQLVSMGSRAMDLLIALLATPGEVVSKESLIARLWPSITVDETSLRVHVANVRKTLREGEGGLRYISNVSGRGYVFVAPITVVTSEDPVEETGILERDHAAGRAEPSETLAPILLLKSTPSTAFGQLPTAVNRIVGRSEIIETLVLEQKGRRCTSIVGPGGVGKTTVALAVARASVGAFNDGVVFADLSPMKDGSFLASTIATRMNIALHPEDPLSSLTSALRDKDVLLILDSCEHIIDDAAELVSALLRYTEGVSILTTSREALRAEGEWVHRLQPLGAPDASTKVSADAIKDYPAVQLFIDRAAEAQGGYTLTDENAPFVAEICHRLEGIALAIELAAGRTDTLNVRELAAQLDDRFRVLKHGRRTAVARHQTLKGMLDWSYDQLTSSQQQLLNRLSIFRGAFDRASARQVCELEGEATGHFDDEIANLIAKSLVAVTRDPARTSFRLLDTTRAYASEKLDSSGERAIIAAAHAICFRNYFEAAARQWEANPSRNWVSEYVWQIENLRSAVEWSFSDSGETIEGVRLTIAAMPLWSQLSLFDEPLDWVSRSLKALSSYGGQDRTREMQLYASLGGLQMYAIASVKQSNNAWERVLAIATDVGDVDFELRAVRALWAEAINQGEFSKALSLADQFRKIEQSAHLPVGQTVSNRLLGTTFHFLGRHDEASDAIERMLQSYEAAENKSDVVRYLFNQKVCTRLIRGRLLWLEGRLDAALEDIAENTQEAFETDHTLSICLVMLQSSCPIAIMAGKETLAKSYLDRLSVLTAARVLDIWHTYSAAYHAELAVAFGNVDAGVARLGRAISALRESQFEHYTTSFLAGYARGLLNLNKANQAELAIAEALSQCKRTGEGWQLPELLRLKGEAIRRLDPDAKAVAAIFHESMSFAREQRALTWELRTASSLARLQVDTGVAPEAPALLEKVYGRFSEGFDCRDLVEARELLAQF